MKEKLLEMMRIAINANNTVDDYLTKEYFHGKIAAIEEMMNWEGMSVFVEWKGGFIKNKVLGFCYTDENNEIKVEKF